MQEKKITISWFGTASLRITTGSSTVFVDPFVPYSDSPVRISQQAFTGCKHILITHGHFDHIGSIKDLIQPDTNVYCTKTPRINMRHLGVPERNIRLIQAGDVLNLDEFQITVLKGAHLKNGGSVFKALFNKRVLRERKGVLRKIYQFTSCREKNETVCYLIEAYGKRILTLGSLALADGVTYAKDIDLLALPYQGSPYLLDISQHIYGKIKARNVLLTHYDNTFPPFSSEIDTSEFEKCMKERTKVFKIRQGESITI